MKTREEWLVRLKEVLSRPVRWDNNPIGDYDGRERTLEVFYADADIQLQLLYRLRPLRWELERDLGGPIIIIFHTSKETARLYPSIEEEVK